MGGIIILIGQSSGTDENTCPEIEIISPSGPREDMPFDSMELGLGYLNNNEWVDCFEVPKAETGYYSIGYFKVTFRNTFMPGEGEFPEMFLCAYINDMNNLVGVSEPLEFNVEGNLIVSELNIIDVNAFFTTNRPEFLCSGVLLTPVLSTKLD